MRLFSPSLGHIESSHLEIANFPSRGDSWQGSRRQPVDDLFLERHQSRDDT